MGASGLSIQEEISLMRDDDAAADKASDAEKSILERLQRLQTNPQRRSDESYRRNKKWSWPFGNVPADRWAELAFALALTVATIVNVCIANRQWIVANRQASIADNTEKLSLRAYLGIDNEKFVLNCAYCTDQSTRTDYAKGFTDDNALIVPITNYDHTLAFDAIGYFNWKDATYGGELGSDFSYSDGAQVIVPGTFFVINPQEADHGGILLGSSDMELIRRARDHQITLYIYGHIDYTDAFSCRETLKFCFRYAPDAKPEHRFGLCQAHNEAPIGDKGCNRESSYKRPSRVAK